MKTPIMFFPLILVMAIFSYKNGKGEEAHNLSIHGDDSLHSLDSPIRAQTAPNNPIELGKVNWYRNLDEAMSVAKRQNKPVFILFQEVPGCSTSSGYGRNVLSHPLIIDAIETLFVPVAIYNNEGGDDRKTLEAFGEPSWNNPVVRIITPDRKELAPRLSGDYSQKGLVNTILQALKENNQPVPSYLQIFSEELNSKNSGLEKVTFAMHCFWEGEANFGNLNGVISTNPGYMNGYEVVEVEFNPSVISFSELVEKAKYGDAASKVFFQDETQRITANNLFGENSVSVIGTFRPDNDPKRYLSQTSYRYVPMTNLQASRVNSAIAGGQSPERLLSPSQLKLHEFIKNHPDYEWQNSVASNDFTKAWNTAMTIVTNHYDERI